MEPVNLGYSTKNIPTAQPKEYLRCLIEKTESFLRRMRWKAFHFMNPTESTANKQTFGFKTTTSPAPIKELKAFEDKMLTLIQNIEFKNVNNEFQNELSRDATKIKKDNKLLIAADKTTNFYRVDTTSYNQLMKTSITKSYKKAPSNAASKIIAEEKKIAGKLDLGNRIDALADKESFVTLKDHKPNFVNNPTCRLINPSKSEIGVISKKILQRINSKVIEATGINQWKDTGSVIKWYKNIPDKPEHSFICFDIVEFYPSISEDLLTKALMFASEYDEITEVEINIIIQTKNSLLFNENVAWCKKSSNQSHFDVTMGSFDGAETCELVGSYLLSKLTPKYGNKIGLYRDDGLAAFNESPREIENIKKQICKTFGEHNLKLTIEANKKSVNYLDITLDLRSETFKPYTKPGNIPHYINRHSNHPPSILRNIPEAINRRLSNISSDKQAFDSAIPPYQEALKKSGYDHILNFHPHPPKEKRPRSRNVIWFNPPYSVNVATNIGHIFLETIKECFPNNHPLHKIFNRNTVKLSYCCMPNMQNIISSHNKSTLKNESTSNATTAKACNCRRKDTCPVKGKCQTEGVVYQATVTREDNKREKNYVGLTERTFKTRYFNHTTSFRHEKHKNSTELSKYVWSLKESNVKYAIKWRIMKRCKPYSNRTKRCNLCLYEKYLIICHPELSTLNSRNELISTCRHRKKHLLCSQ